MKKIVILVALVLIPLSLSAGADKVLGKWDCEAVVDMTYPFIMTLEKSGEELTGRMSGDSGSLDLESVSYKEGTLKFQINHPDGGLIDFEGKPGESGIEGTLGNEMFVGDFACEPVE
jgi:hypothetical protein